MSFSDCSETGTKLSMDPNSSSRSIDPLIKIPPVVDGGECFPGDTVPESQSTVNVNLTDSTVSQDRWAVLSIFGF